MKRRQPYECIPDGKPPCPICPVRGYCAWAGRVLREQKGQPARKSSIVNGRSEIGSGKDTRR